MEKAAAGVPSQGPKIGDRVAVEGALISFLSGGEEARVRLDTGMPFSPAVISAAPKSLTVVAAEEFGPCIGCGRQQTRNPHPDAGQPGHEGAGYAWHCVPCLEENRHRWAIRARRAEGNIRRALDMLDSFDPTSGSARARVLVSDLRNCLDAVNDA